MKFDAPATDNPIDRLRVVGKPTDRIDGPLKTSASAAVMPGTTSTRIPAARQAKTSSPPRPRPPPACWPS